MMELILIRHGQVDAAWRDRLYGSMDVPLSSEGQKQARAVSRELASERLDEVVSSGLARAEFTAQILRSQRPGLERRDDPRLVERDRGDWAGLSVDEIDQRFPLAADLWRESRGLFTPPAGESVEQVMARVGFALDECAERHVGGRVAIVAHMWVVRVAVAWALGLHAERVDSLHVPTAGRVRLHWDPKGSFGSRGGLLEMHGTPELTAADSE